MKFTLKFELVNYDVAYALALAAEREVGSTEAVRHWISTRGRTEVKEIAKQQVQRNGESEFWAEVAEDELMQTARAHVDHLWPDGI